MVRARSSDFSRLEPLLVLSGIVLILYFARELLIPLAFALTLSFLLAPAVSRLEAVHAPRVVAVAVTGIIALAVLLGVGYVVTHQLLNLARDLPAYRLDIQRRLSSVHSPAEQSLERALSAVEGIGADLTSGAHAPSKPSSILLQLPTSEAQPVRIVDPNRNDLQTSAEMIFRVLRPVGTLGIVIVFTIYLLMKREDLRHRILLLAGIGRIGVMTEALEDAATRVSRYLGMQLAVNAGYGILFGSGLYLIGVPDATLWGAMAGILRIVPYVGTATGLVFPLVVSVAVFPAWWPPAAVLALFFTLELSATNFVEPWLYSSRTGISSLALLTMAIFWTLLWGWPGLILSTPLTVCFVVIGQYVPQMSFLHTLLGSDAELSPEAHFYERLLALDGIEAREVANKFLCGRPLVELYDEVFVPALRMVEQDRHQGTLDESRANFFFLSIGELIAELSDYRQAMAVEGKPAGEADAGDSPGPGSWLRRQLSAARNIRIESHDAGREEASGRDAAATMLPGRELAGGAMDLDLRTAAADAARGQCGVDGVDTSPAEPAPMVNDFAVICISASDQADELTSHMLAQVMERAGHPTLLLSAASISREVLEGLALEPNTVIFISALPPFAFSQARATCQRVRGQLPQNRIVIGFWESAEAAPLLPGQAAGQAMDRSGEALHDPTMERFGSGRPTLVVNTLAQALRQVEVWQQQPAGRVGPRSGSQVATL